ncbi:ABC transporter substrate-binding protein [Betaproteobacteria bacterium]|nr:ABC transporter substrate-binding protein [Betaproteobacteria bacterium]
MKRRDLLKAGGVAGILAAGQFALGTSAAFAADKTWKLKLCHGLAPEHPYQLGSLEFGRLIKEYTKGRVTLEVFPNGQLAGSEREMYEGLQMGTLDMTASTASALVPFDKSWAIFDLPYLFRDKQHAYKVLDGDYGKEKLKSLEKVNIVGLAFWECGMFSPVYSGAPIKNPGDMKGRTIRTIETPITMTWVAALGANPVPMAWSEVFTAIQNKTVDGTLLPMTTIYFSKLYTVAKNISRVESTYQPLPLTISKKTWDTMPDDIKALMYKAAIEARDYMRNLNAQFEDEKARVMASEGVNVISYTPEEKKLWIDVIRKEAYPNLIPKFFSQEEVARIQAL